MRFHCSAANASDISWRINGSSKGRSFMDQTREIFTETDLNLLESNLTISSMVINNNTRIQCRVRHLDEHNFTLTDEALFRVQGQLANVEYRIDPALTTQTPWEQRAASPIINTAQGNCVRALTYFYFPLLSGC